MTEEKIKKLANDIYLDPSDEVISLTKKILASIDKELKALELFDLDQIKALSRLSNIISFSDLREDKIENSQYLDKEKMLANAPSKNSDFVTIKKVVND